MTLQGLQRQVALVARLLRDEVDPVTLDALQLRCCTFNLLSPKC